MRTKLTVEEVEFIRQNCDAMSGAEIARALGKSDRCSLNRRAKKLGLRKKPKSEPSPDPPRHWAVKEDGWIKGPALDQLMAGSANPRPRQHKVEA